MKPTSTRPLVSIACGGTGGHLFPGLAVGQVLLSSGCDVELWISEKRVDQEAARAAEGMEVRTLPARGVETGAGMAPLRTFFSSHRRCVEVFQARRPAAVLAMGGFTSAPVVLAGRRFGAVTAIHEANAFPGKANRWLAPWVDFCCVAFPEAGPRLRNAHIHVTGMPVREQFRPADPGSCRMALGLDPARDVLLVMGGSQGARAINQLMIQSAPAVSARFPGLQVLHLTGSEDLPDVKQAYTSQRIRAVVRPFLTEMDLALGAATLAVSRAGASSLAEFGAMGLPAVLIPYPTAADDHQRMNARAVAGAGAAVVLEQSSASPERLVPLLEPLLGAGPHLESMRAAMRAWFKPEAATRVASRVLEAIGHAGAGAGSGADAPIEEDRGTLLNRPRLPRLTSPLGATTRSGLAASD